MLLRMGVPIRAHVMVQTVLEIKKIHATNEKAQHGLKRV
jgi:hypothetical protein